MKHIITISKNKSHLSVAPSASAQYSMRSSKLTHSEAKKRSFSLRSFRCAYKPDFVPILPTEGGCRIENPKPVEGLPLDFTRGARFCNCLRQVKSAQLYIWDGRYRPPRAALPAPVLRNFFVQNWGWTRPCTEVRILPLHPYVSARFILADA
jgi:hypothetical protein